MSKRSVHVETAPEFRDGMDAAVVEWQRNHGSAVDFGAGLEIARRQFIRMLTSRHVSYATPGRISVDDSIVQTAGGDVPVRSFRPEGRAEGAIVFFHGGGWVFGNLETHDAPCREIASVSRMQVFSVDYPLAPEHTHREILDACVEVTQRLGQESSPLIVAGDSAGGHLAALVAEALADEQIVSAQLLLYPVTDLTLDSPAMLEHSRCFPLTAEQMAYFREALLGPDASSADIKAASPLDRVRRGLPPAVVATAEFDPLRDDGSRYAARLSEHQVPVIFQPHHVLMHGWLDWFAISSAALDALTGAVTSAVELADLSRSGKEQMKEQRRQPLTPTPA